MLVEAVRTHLYYAVEADYLLGLKNENNERKLVHFVVDTFY